MSVRIYGGIRHEAAIGLFNWIEQPMAAAIPHVDYVPNYDTDRLLSIVQPLRGPLAPISEQALHEAGWFQLAPISFSSMPINSVVDKVIIYRIADGALVLALEFTAFVSTTGAPFTIAYGIDQLGLCRL